MPLPFPPAEIPRKSSVQGLAPQFKAAVEAIVNDMQAQGWLTTIFETIRTEERQRYLYGFGRDYDDGRGPVTKAQSAKFSWHRYGLAADIVQADSTPWTAPQAFWQALGLAAESHGCVWGGRWKALDLPHIQWGKCPRSPTMAHVTMYNKEGLAAVWTEVGAN